jgi:hypothetical protein
VNTTQPAQTTASPDLTVANDVSPAPAPDIPLLEPSGEETDIQAEDKSPDDDPAATVPAAYAVPPDVSSLGGIAPDKATPTMSTAHTDEDHGEGFSGAQDEMDDDESRDNISSARSDAGSDESALLDANNLRTTATVAQTQVDPVGGGF